MFFDSLPERTFVIDDVINMCVQIFQYVFQLLQTNFYQYHNFRLSFFDFALSLMVLDAACLLIFPWYSSDDENE